MHNRKYVIISPCRDEAAFMRRTLETVTSQTMPPARWVIVDDGSTDESPAILAEYADRFPYIQILRREDRGRRSVGPGVIEAFYAGLSTVPRSAFEFICKLDLDLELPPSYFQALIERMDSEPRLGTCSGKAYYRDRRTGRLVSEGIGDEMSVGAAKFYRMSCFNQIGGFVREVMWDGIDCHRCRMHGWQACSFADEKLRFIHLRPMGSSQQGIWSGRARHGAGQYFMGTGLAYMTVSSLYRMTRPPLITGGLAMWCGYISSWLRNRPRYQDAEFRRFLRDYQHSSLVRGKHDATRLCDQRQRAHWYALNSANEHGRLAAT